MAKLHGLPVYKIVVNEDLSDDTGIEFISLVDYPAIESNWVAMGKKGEPMKFASKPDERILLGPILIPEQPIYRYSAQMGEYYVVFTADEIKKLVRKFQATQKTINVNYQHLEDSKVENSVIQEIWLSGDNDKSKDYGFDLPKGTAFVAAFIGNKDFWEKEIKSGNVRGFSIEGFLNMELKKIELSMNSKDKFSVYKQKDGGSDIYIDGDISVDNYVFSNYPCVKLVNGQRVVEQYPVLENTIVLEDGTILTLKDSKIIKIEKQQSMSMNTAKTKDGIEIHTDSESWVSGVDVYTMEPDGSKKPVPDGEYTLESGDVLMVSGGKVSEIKAWDGEMSEEEQATLNKMFAPLMKVIDEKLAAIEAKIDNKPATTPVTTPVTQSKNTPISMRKQLLNKMDAFRNRAKELQTNQTATN